MDAGLFCNANVGKSGHRDAFCHALSACPPAAGEQVIRRRMTRGDVNGETNAVCRAALLPCPWLSVADLRIIKGPHLTCSDDPTRIVISLQRSSLLRLSAGLARNEV